MERFEDALKGLAIDDKRTREKIAPLLKQFLEASQELQRTLTPLNGSVHAAISRARAEPRRATTVLCWMSVFDRVGLFNTEDISVSRLIDAALRYVWRKEQTDALIASLGVEGDRMVAETRRGLERNGEAAEGAAAGEGSTALDGDEATGSQIMTLPALRKRVAFSPIRPSICVPTSSVFAAAKTVINAVAASKHPSALCREIGVRVCKAYQTFLVARAGLTVEALMGATGARARDESGTPSTTNTASSTLPPNGARTGAAAADHSGSTGIDSANGRADAGSTPTTPSASAANYPSSSAAATASTDAAAATASTDEATAATSTFTGGAAAPPTAAAAAAATDASATVDSEKDGPVTAAGAPADQATTTVTNEGAGTSAAREGGGGNEDGKDPTATSEATNGSMMLVFGYLVAYLRTKCLTTWKSQSGGKAPAPVGTMANPTGLVAVDKSRSLWCPRVQMAGIKPELKVPSLAAKRFKLSNIPDVLLLVDITTFKSKSIAEVIGVLLLLCTYDPELPRIVEETVSAEFESRPSRQPSLVLSGLELSQPSGEGGDVTDGGVDAATGAGMAARATAATAVRSAAGSAAVMSNDQAAGGAGDGHDVGGVAGAAAAAAAASSDAGAAYRPGDGAGANVVNGSVRAGGGRQDPNAARGGPPGVGDGDGIQDGTSVALQAAYYMRAMRATAANRANRLSILRASRAAQSAAEVAKAAAEANAVEDAQVAAAAVLASSTSAAGSAAGAAGPRPPPARPGRRPPLGPPKRRAPAGAPNPKPPAKKRKAAAGSVLTNTSSGREPAAGGASAARAPGTGGADATGRGRATSTGQVSGESPPTDASPAAGASPALGSSQAVRASPAVRSSPAVG